MYGEQELQELQEEAAEDAAVLEEELLEEALDGAWLEEEARQEMAP